MNQKTINKIRKQIDGTKLWRRLKKIRNPNGKRYQADMRRVKKAMGLI